MSQKHFDDRRDNTSLSGDPITEASTVPISAVKSMKRRRTRGVKKTKIVKRVRRVQIGSGKKRSKKSCSQRKCVRRRRGRK